jgi:hypothetical protein
LALDPVPCGVMRPRLILSIVLVAALLGACNDASAPSAGATITPVTASPANGESEAPVSVEPSAAPPSEAAETTDPATETESPAPAEPSPSGSAGPGPAAACSGSDANRDFYSAAAATLSWDVYCAVLPAGWFVDSGQYRRASGGWVEIAYRGPGGARLELHQGAFCSASDGCVPSGTDAGDASFGDKAGTFIALDDGGWAVVVDRAEQISWLAVGTGLDEAAFRAIAGALSRVGG